MTGLRLKRLTRWRLAGAVLLAVLAVLLAQNEVSLCGLDSGRFSLVESWGERGVFYTEESGFANPDRVVFNGHQYSDKPLPLTLAAAWIHRQIHNFTGITFAGERRLAVKLVNTVFMFLCSWLLFCWTFNLFLRERGGSLPVKWLLALGPLFLTIAGSYAVVLNNHLPAALAVLGILISVRKFERKPAAEAAVLAGLAAGIAGVTELPLGIPAGVLAVVLIYPAAPVNCKLKYTALTIAGGLAVLAGYLALNYYAYQDIRPLYVVQGGSYQVPGRQAAELGKYFFHILIGERGIFSYHWFLLPGLWVLLTGRRGRSGVCWGLFALWVLIFYGVFTNEYGGWSYGFRYYIPLLPVLYYFTGTVRLRCRPSRWRLAVTALAVLWGVTVTAAGAYAPYCVTYEGMRTRRGDFTEQISCPVTGNALFWLYRQAPDSAVYRYLASRYEPENLRKFLFWQHVNLNVPEPRLGVTERVETLKKVLGAGEDGTLH